MFLVSLSSLFHKSRTVGKKLSLYDLVRHWGGVKNLGFLKKLYFGFIRPILEYGSVVWDNCTREQSDLIESVQYESARIATGLRKGTSRDKLYAELGWDSLQNRRKKQKLILMSKALEGELPNYITNNIISYSLVFEALKLTHQSDAQVLRLFKSEFRDSAVSF
jgi:hypothetical protein